MARKSAGIVLYRYGSGGPEVLLVHPGGPYWEHKDLGAWTIPKGEFHDDETAEAAARREFEEETGFLLSGPLTPLHEVKNKSGKIIFPFTLQADLNASDIRSNTFSMEWPPKSGTIQDFPEIDSGDWFPIDIARQKINVYQVPILDELESMIMGKA
jgi:predicted NUDIX family NTP pyrophosphohydrolase